MRKSLKTRLVSALALVGLIVLLIGLAGFIGMARTEKALENIYENKVKAIMLLNEVHDRYAVVIVDAPQKFAYDMLSAQQAKDVIASAVAEGEQKWKTYLATEHSERESQLIAQAESLKRDVVATILKLNSLIAPDQKEQLKTFNQQSLYQTFDPFITKLKELIREQELEVLAVLNQAKANYKAFSWFLGAAILSGLLLLFWLGKSLMRMTTDLAMLISEARSSGIHLNTSINEIAGTAREQQATATEVAATTSEIGATSKEISATSKELLKTVNNVTDVSEKTAILAGNGQSGLVQMEGTMKQVIQASGVVNSKLAVVSDKAANITQVVTTINKIADQTNLLSLNAAIEAEKAGEYGRGFSVVATEIRRLADQTAVATYDIDQIVKEMQTAVSAGVMGMDKFSEEVRRGVQDVQLVSQQLAEIIRQVQTLAPQFETVQEGMQSQAMGAQQISEALSQLSEAAQQSVDSLRQSNQALEQLNQVSAGLKKRVEEIVI
ncbi:MAG: HAMP domain-containing methyl-accepting chemotaxis protein [Verrucomicrobiales bacterium]